MRRVAGLALLVFLLAGCGQKEADQQGMNARFERLDYHEVLTRDLQVMDASAISLARENRIPILVFSIFESGGFAEVVQGKGRYTIIEEIS